MAYFDTVWYVNGGDGATTGYYAVPKWTPSTFYPPGSIVRPTNPAIGNERIYISVNPSGGTSGATEPTWTIVRGSQVTDATVAWDEISGQAAVNGDYANTMWWLGPTTLVSKALSAHMVVRNTAGTHLFIVNSAGTTAGVEPTWNTATGANTVSGSCNFCCIGPITSFQTPFAYPAARIQNISVANYGAGGNDIFVADNHAEASINQILLNLGTVTAPCRFFSVDHTQPLPPTAATLKAGASVTTTNTIAGAVSVCTTSQCSQYWNGFTFTYNGTAATYGLYVGVSTLQTVKFENCSFQLGPAAAPTAAFAFGSTASGSTNLEMVNCTFGFNNIAQYISMGSGNFVWRNTPDPCLVGSILPTNLIKMASGGTGIALFEGVDLTKLGANTLYGQGFTGTYATIKNCKLHSGVIVAPNIATMNSMQVDVVASDGAGGAMSRNERYHINGTHISVAASLFLARTGGASDGVNPQTWQLLPTNFAKNYRPFPVMPMMIWNNVVGTPVTLTLYGIWNSNTQPTNNQLWLDVEYPGVAGSTMALVVSNGQPNSISTPVSHSADTASGWDSLLPIRQNSHVYTGGTFLAVPSNPGRVFNLISGGTSAASEPAGYATATDGGSFITDGTMNVRALYRFALSVTFTAQQRGYVTAYLKVGTSGIFWVDPQPVLS